MEKFLPLVDDLRCPLQDEVNSIGSGINIYTALLEACDLRHFGEFSEMSKIHVLQAVHLEYDLIDQ